jgi:Na+/H+ antiporter NhaD/arsenite permease-like protein
MRNAPALRAAIAAGLLGLPALASAAEIDGASLAAWWAVPFAGVLLSIAIMPLAALKVWHHHYGKIVLGWMLAFLVPYMLLHGAGAAGGVLVHTLVAEYIPFIVLLTALFTAAGGIYIPGNLKGSPATNVALIAIGGVLASLMGTTGASMLMIRPLIRANDNRKHVAHVVVFFIFVVANIGGSLTPLGDPPLFLGFLKGVEFFWTLRHIFPHTAFATVVLLVVFYAIDSYWYRM